MADCCGKIGGRRRLTRKASKSKKRSLRRRGGKHKQTVKGFSGKWKTRTMIK
jgi:hypothetical protein